MTAVMRNVSLAGFVVLLLGVAGCGKRGPAAPPPAAEAPRASAVTLVKPQLQTLRCTIEQPAHIEAFEETPLVARIAGYVGKVNADIGDRVRKDDVLAELHVPEMEIELRQKEALVRQAEAELKLAKDSLPLTEAEVKRTKSQAERFAKVGGNGVLDRENIEETQYSFEASKARLEMARSEVSVREARLAVARENRDFAQAMLQYRLVRAPFDGVVVRRHIDTGHFLQPGAGASAQPLFVVASTGVMRVFADVSEAEAPLVSDGCPARIRVQTLKGQEFVGKVTRSSWSLDARARTLRVEIDLPNPQGVLRPGMYATVQLHAEFSNRLTLPTTAVANQGVQTVCFQVVDGKTVSVPVQTGLRAAGLVEVLKKLRLPAKPGETVWENFTGEEACVQAGLAGLTDGQPVEVAGGAK
ncbi:MAG: efflux RND transporter periplasmic adaptor subunit [Planctomycetia bacterium]|nr:efflux RND transporter periplasmic adaptor subunit [Planctomycetia bacterium]